MTKKILALLLSLALLCLCACGAAPDKPAADSAPSDSAVTENQPEANDEKEPAKTKLRIGYYGQASDARDFYPEDYELNNTGYDVERLEYGADDAGYKRLILDVQSGRLDLVICDGQVETTSGFADLYAFIDADAELTRGAFPAWLLAGLEERGRLNQLWGGFVVNTLKAKGALALEPSPLTLENCRAYITENRIDTPFFDSYIVKDQLLDYMLPPIMNEAFDPASGSFSFADPHIAALIELCNQQPAEFDWEAAMTDGGMPMSDVLEWVSLGGTNSFEDKELEQREVRRYFGGADGGENFTYVSCLPKCCYMIPETAADKDAAWGYLRSLLLADWQQRYYEARRFGLPGNTAAREAVLSEYAAPETIAELNALMDNAPVFGGENRIMGKMLAEEIRRYFSGESNLDSVLGMAESKLNMRYAEQHG